ncbi:unnamed protein product [Gongylonema pulchrum]|uniref:Uncharacterized protein n=1 Tax=Gongylonema pulchrum TaxID=637853 RepID=A0A183DXM2_9BILA|nr:unnamed protein product [Gongylonema pulchrum]
MYWLQRASSYNFVASLVRPTPQVPVLKKSLATTATSAAEHDNKCVRGMTFAGDNSSPSSTFHSQPSSAESANCSQPSSDETPVCSNGTGESLPSEYAHLSDHGDRAAAATNQNGKDDDDVSVAGTVFNEPWDSTVWENLLDLAHYGDEKPSTLTRHYELNQIGSVGDAIAEEEGDDEVACSLEMSYDGEEERNLQKSQQHHLSGKRCSDDYGTVVRRLDNHSLAESDGRRNGVINIHAHLKNESSLRRQQLEASRSVCCV